MCEDYRATYGVDFEMDKDFAAGKKITCPALILWGATGAVGRNHKPAEVWQDYATDIRGAKALPCGHYLSEEAPEETYAGAARVLPRAEGACVAASGANRVFFAICGETRFSAPWVQRSLFLVCSPDCRSSPESTFPSRTPARRFETSRQTASSPFMSISPSCDHAPRLTATTCV